MYLKDERHRSGIRDGEWVCGLARRKSAMSTCCTRLEKLHITGRYDGLLRTTQGDGRKKKS